MITIEHYDGLNRTPALRLALAAQLELLENELCEPLLNIFWDQQAVVGFWAHEGCSPRPVGVLTWNHVPAFKHIDVALAYVEPQRRLGGVYTAMWAGLVDKARALGVEFIISSTSTENVIMRKIARGQKRSFFGSYLKYTVRPIPKLVAIKGSAPGDAPKG